MKKIDLEDTLYMLRTQLEQFEEMKKIAEENHSPFLRAEAIGGIIALQALAERLDRYTKSKGYAPRHTISTDTMKVIEATHQQYAQNGTTK